LNSLLDTISKAVELHFEHLGSDIFILHGFASPRKRTACSLFNYTTPAVFFKEKNANGQGKNIY